jgi:hypothetical protein
MVQQVLIVEVGSPFFSEKKNPDTSNKAGKLKAKKPCDIL